MSLSKAQLIITPSNLDSGGEITYIPLHLNPNKIDVSRGLKVERAPNAGGTRQEGRVASVDPITFKLDALVFDTYETRTSVRRTVIDKLEDAICKGSVDDRTYSMIRFHWGQFTDSKHNSEYQFLLRGFDCSYQVFLPDGTPVRALVTLRLEQFIIDPPSVAESAAAKASSEAQIHTVRKGETAQSMAAKLLGDPRKWRDICDANKVDPMNIPPGTQLLVPPARMGAA